MAYQHLLYSVDDRVAKVVLNRPERHNALGKLTVDEIIAVLAEADADPEVRVIVITGAGGKAFSAGYDIKESAEAPKRTLPEWRARMQKDIKFTYAAWDCSKPVIAMINGFCLAGALEFAQCCDMRYCSEDSSFGVVETRFSNGIATMMMPWVLGNRCRELIYTGDRFGAGGPGEEACGRHGGEACDRGLEQLPAGESFVFHRESLDRFRASPYGCDSRNFAARLRRMRTIPKQGA